MYIGKLYWQNGPGLFELTEASSETGVPPTPISEPSMFVSKCPLRLPFWGWAASPKSVSGRPQKNSSRVKPEKLEGEPFPTDVTVVYPVV